MLNLYPRWAKQRRGRVEGSDGNLSKSQSSPAPAVDSHDPPENTWTPRWLNVIKIFNVMQRPENQKHRLTSRVSCYFFFASLETHTPLHTPSRAASTLNDIVWLRSNLESSLWNRSRLACISNDSLLMCVECSREINRKKNFKPLLLHGLMGLQRSHHSYFYSPRGSLVCIRLICDVCAK